VGDTGRREDAVTTAERVPAGPLRFGLSLINFGDFADARRVADIAREAERAGWDALLVWDHLAFAWGMPTGDPWTLVTACALATERLLVGTDVAVVARERPLPFANRLSTIDRLSGGRVVLGVGIGGAPDEYRMAGEPADLRERAALTDEMLAVLRPLLAGETVRHAGPSLTVDEVTLAPLPAQARIPVWVGGGSRGARRRAARHDGWIPVTVDDEGRPCLTPGELRVALAEIRADRAAAGVAAGAPFVVGIHGETPGPGAAGAAVVRPWAEAGATWWLEMLHGWRGSTGDLFARVAAGPPRG
jgi:alkanesulfonate monooxygenase SsuD/methylene tetrahydromethanopterin reductase-like flavin-dependent oxidoreductase (luciferase family)